MKLDEIYENIREDFSDLDRTDLSGESIKSSKLFTKYIVLYSEMNKQLKLMQEESKNLRRSLREYYSGNQNGLPSQHKKEPFQKVIKTEKVLMEYVDNDEEMISMNKKIALLETKVETLKACLDEVHRRGYNIRAAVDWERFINGG